MFGMCSNVIPHVSEEILHTEEHGVQTFIMNCVPQKPAENVKNCL